ncbi:hypothetical protein BOX15_Mlig022212g6 [Macrostomum lignano]|uniref:Protein kinase domain-containing protein n=2 Tax=Macrostomum lignano TaxID=282301 RepID=A0A1I8J679_9PLAT|nr:hypothetical protein BOX15_Mlig022212g6 [Macrostomum lignano]
MANEKRVSSLIALDELQKSSDMQEMAQRMEAQKNMEIVRSKATDVLSLVALSPEFNQLFLVQSVEDMSAFVFSYKSDRTIIIDMLARCPREQITNFETYKFASHPEFEKKISQYTRTAEKPNNQLAKCRPWDVALCLILKIEALDTEAMQQPNMRLLFRENLIIKHLWDNFMRETMELDEMTGIPIVFKYDEVSNPTFNYDLAEYKVYDVYGNLVPWKSESRSTLSYLCMEQLGPNLQYLTEVMVSGKRRGYVFDVDTALKIFDQLLCRCLQIHRFGVTHNAIEPHNLYFGRSIAFNVLYIANFNVATLFDPKDPNNMRKSGSDSELYGHLRFASHIRMKGGQAHPVHDLESAFYTLVALLTNNLPWDSCLSTGGSSSKTGAAGRGSVVDNINLSNTVSNQSDITKSIERNSMMQKLREFKTNFWKSNNGIARVLADLQYMAFGVDRHRVSLTVEIIKDLYAKIRDLINTVGSDSPQASFFSNLLLQHTTEYQTYTDLRRTVLMMYRFESISAFINTPTYQKKIESLAHDEVDVNVRLAWNLTNWCFNGVEVNVLANNTTSVVKSTAKNVVARTVE